MNVLEEFGLYPPVTKSCRFFCELQKNLRFYLTSCVFICFNYPCIYLSISVFYPKALNRPFHPSIDKIHVDILIPLKKGQDLKIYCLDYIYYSSPLHFTPPPPILPIYMGLSYHHYWLDFSTKYHQQSLFTYCTYLFSSKKLLLFTLSFI